MARFDLVIFDCDGVVVDSERIVHEVFGSFIRSLGVRLTEVEMREQFLGRALAECMAIVERTRGKPAPAGALERYCDGARPRVARASASRSRGFARCSRALTIPFCIASSGGYDKMHITLGATELMPFFEGRMFSATRGAARQAGARHISIRRASAWEPSPRVQRSSRTP